MALPQNQAHLLLSFQSGHSMKLTISRHLAPRTYAKVVESLPLEGAASLSNNMVVLLVNLTAQADKTKRNFEAGEVAYNPHLRAICIILGEVRDVPMAALGKVEDKSALSGIRSRDWVTLGLA